MKLRITIFSLIVIALVAFLMAGCTDKTKENPIAPQHASGLTLNQGFTSYAILFCSMADLNKSETGFKPV